MSWLRDKVRQIGNAAESVAGAVWNTAVTGSEKIADWEKGIVQTSYGIGSSKKSSGGSSPAAVPNIPAPEAQSVIFGTVAGGGSAISATEKAAWAQLRGQIATAARGSTRVIGKVPGIKLATRLVGMTPYGRLIGGVFTAASSLQGSVMALEKWQNRDTNRRMKAVNDEIRARIKAKVLSGQYTGAQHLEPYKSGNRKGQLHIVPTFRVPAKTSGATPNGTVGKPPSSPKPKGTPRQPKGGTRGRKTAASLDPFDTNKLQARQYDWLRKHDQVLAEVQVSGGRYPVPPVPGKLSKAYAVAAAVFGLPNWNNPAQVAKWITTLNPKKPGKTRSSTVSAIRPGGGGSSVLRVAKPAKKKRRRRKKKAAKKKRTRRRLTRNRTRRVR